MVQGIFKKWSRYTLEAFHDGLGNRFIMSLSTKLCNFTDRFSVRIEEPNGDPDEDQRISGVCDHSRGWKRQSNATIQVTVAQSGYSQAVLLLRGGTFVVSAHPGTGRSIPIIGRKQSRSYLRRMSFFRKSPTIAPS